MEIEIPSRKAQVCDFCQREGFLSRCDCCGRSYCLTDDGVVPGSFGFLKICRACDDRDDVRAICARYAERLGKLFTARDEEIRKLDKKLKEGSK